LGYSQKREGEGMIDWDGVFAGMFQLHHRIAMHLGDPDSMSGIDTRCPHCGKDLFIGLLTGTDDFDELWYVVGKDYDDVVSQLKQSNIDEKEEDTKFLTEFNQKAEAMKHGS
jgi:hypothetical protein